MVWPPPLDWTGVFAGACRVPELLEELAEFEELEFEELEFDELEFEFAEPDPEFVPDEAALPEPEPEPRFVVDEPPVRALADELLVLVTAACVEPGSATATAPAAITLANPTVAVVAFSRRRPRSRSATAREMWLRGALAGPVARGAP